MDILLHTIALEPARWTAQRVSRPLADLIPVLAEAGFDQVEIYEPHLALAPDESALAGLLSANRVAPAVLSSYLDLSPAATVEDDFVDQAKTLLTRVERFGFRKVRFFPGRSPSRARVLETVQGVARRLRYFADRRADVEFLLETHDGSLADDPACLVSLLRACARGNVGLLWQPTVFESRAARAQFALQQPFIRHCHLQNRTPDGDFATLGAGVIPWGELLGALPSATDLTLEFVPGAICPPEQFDLAASLREAQREFRWICDSITLPRSAPEK